MPENMRLPRFLIAVLSIGLAAPASAWTSQSQGPGDHDPHANPRADGRITGPPQGPYPNPPWDSVPPAPPYPDHRRQPLAPGGYPPGYPGSERQAPGGPSQFQVSRAATDDAYTLTLKLNGIDPQEVQIRTQGHWLILDRTHSVQHTQDKDLPEDRGFMRSFSYSSSTSNLRYAIPCDGDPGAMSREDREDSIHISIPRHSGKKDGKE